ncbi:putative pentatricopeptide [Medicago truncatula]|uniref:Putative pentatricopeptide n=1 Tax=Medicago truncatula TaxID=3880 RepID=A0A396H147_MEDTR|nr:putative pentatricopeptide [Medicago truncatula]
MHDRCQQADIITYTSLFDALFKNHKVYMAIALLKKIKDHRIEPYMFIYTLLVDGLCKNGRLQDTQEVYPNLTIKGYRFEVRMYSTMMITGLCKESLLYEALSLLSKMEDNGCNPDGVTCEIIVRAFPASSPANV